MATDDELSPSMRQALGLSRRHTDEAHRKIAKLAAKRRGEPEAIERLEDEITGAQHDIEKLKRQAAQLEQRPTMPSAGEIHVHVEAPKPPSVPPHLAILGKYGKPAAWFVGAVTALAALAKQIWDLVHGK